MIYVIKHPNAAFSGHAGIDFQNGVGSTSSLTDARAIAARIRGEIVQTIEDAGMPPISRPAGTKPNTETPKAEAPADVAPAPETPKAAKGRAKKPK